MRQFWAWNHQRTLGVNTKVWQKPVAKTPLVNGDKWKRSNFSLGARLTVPTERFISMPLSPDFHFVTKGGTIENLGTVWNRKGLRTLFKLLLQFNLKQEVWLLLHLNLSFCLPVKYSFDIKKVRLWYL
jgi:hypothetical protein